MHDTMRYGEAKQDHLFILLSEKMNVKKKKKQKQKKPTSPIGRLAWPLSGFINLRKTALNTLASHDLLAGHWGRHAVRVHLRVERLNNL